MFSALQSPSSWAKNQNDMRHISRRKSNLIGILRRNPHRHKIAKTNEPQEAYGSSGEGRGLRTQKGERQVAKR